MTLLTGVGEVMSGDYNRGISYYKRGAYDKAIADYTEAIRLDRKSATAYVNRGRCYAEKNEPNKAIADFTEAIRLVPTNPTFYASRALVYRALGDDAKTTSDEKRARELKW